MRLSLILSFFVFSLSIVSTIDLYSSNNLKSVSNAMEHDGSHHHHNNDAHTPCEDNSNNSCTDHECCMMFVVKSLENSSLKETISIIKFLDNSKIISHKFSDIFRPPII